MATWPFSSSTPSFDCLPHAIVTTYGVIVSASKDFCEYFNCAPGMKIRDLMRIRVINKRVLCATDFFQWEMIYESVGENYKIWMTGIMPGEPTVWNLLKVSMVFCRENGDIICFNNAFELEFGEKREVGELFLSSDEFSDNGSFEVSIKNVRHKVTALKQRNHWLLLIEKYDNSVAVAGVVSSVVHDFRNYLMVINGYAEMAESDRMYLGEIKSTIASAHEMINNLLNFISDKHQEKEVTNALEAIKSIVSGMQFFMGEVEINIKIDIGYVYLSYSQLEQILYNLAKNSQEAGATKIKIVVTQKVLQNWAINGCKMKMGAYLDISIIDNGCGMSEEVQEAIFKRQSVKDRGNGIGLNSIRQILNSVSGGIVVISSPNKGTQIKLYVPSAQTSVKKNVSLVIESAPGVSGSGRIFLVEDNADIRNIFALFLKKHNFDVVEFPSTEEALTYLKSNPKIDLLVTDANLPGNSGAFLANEVKKIAPEVGVVVVSGIERDIITPLFPEKSVFLTKPIGLANLLKEVQHLITEK